MKGSKANSADPDQTSHNVTSDQGLHCLPEGFSIKNRPDTPSDKWTRPTYNSGGFHQYTMG